MSNRLNKARGLIVGALAATALLPAVASAADGNLPARCGETTRTRSYTADAFATTFDWRRGNCPNPGSVKMVATLHHQDQLGRVRSTEVVHKCAAKAKRCSVPVSLPVDRPLDIAEYTAHVTITIAWSNARGDGQSNTVDVLNSADCRSLPSPTCTGTARQVY